MTLPKPVFWFLALLRMPGLSATAIPASAAEIWLGGEEAWVSQALQRCHAVAADPKAKPDDFVVQSWQPLPTKMLPETDPGL
jgi:hypothetical protein